MRSVRVDLDGPPTKGLVEISLLRAREDQKVVKNGINADGRGMSDEGESRINEEENDGRMDLQAHSVLPAQQQPQHQLQGSFVQWERFLPFRSLQILLVENDDSTRHIVSALLQKCSYQVVAASNGLEAWKKLEELTNQIDLVLTEVAMPCLSGIGLLSKIMNHKTFKNIPVIMMSNNDSVGVVYKCLSKGAVDFLVKPIRKNELKILWQHVWRKCHSSSGSGSESGIRIQKSTKSKCAQGSDNNTDSNDEEDDGSIGLNYKDGSDNGSGTQSSWSKRPVDVESPQPMSPWDDSADPPDSTCARVIHSRPEAQSSNWLPTNATRNSQMQNDESENIAMGKDLRIGVPRDLDLEIEDPMNGALGNAAHTEKGSNSTSDLKNGRDDIEKGPDEYHEELAEDKLQDKEIDLMGGITNVTMAHGRNVCCEDPIDPSKTKGLPSLELSLKRARDAGDAGNSSQERNVLRHSDHSAFSRYNTVSTTNQAATGVVGSCSPVDNSSGAPRTESIQNLNSNSSGKHYQGSNGSSNNNDMGSSTNKGFTNSEVVSEKPTAKTTAVGSRTGSAFQIVQHGQSSVLQPAAPRKSDSVKKTAAQACSKHLQQQVEHHHHHHYYHHHHHIHSMDQQKRLLDGDELSLREMISEASDNGGICTECCTANMLRVEIEGDVANYGSASGSNNGSNGQNGSSGQNESSAAVVAEGTLTSDNEGPGKSGVGGVLIGSRSAVEQDRLAQREAALNKFRQKRKERCFEKKVRYQSRKKLAEQRPRIRGQFVRQTVDANKNKEKSNDPDS